MGPRRQRALNVGLQRGDVDEALAASAHTVHEVFRTQRVEHAFLEPESTLAVPDREMAACTSTRVAKVCGTIATRSPRCSTSIHATVTVELVSNGGAFGGKEDMSNQGQTALAAHLLQRPVSCTLTREQSFRIHAKRHPIEIEVWAGCDADGKLTALRSRMIGDSGPYASVGMKVLERAAGHMSGPYVVDTIDVEAIAVRTNNPVCGAFRGFGANQAQFAMEGIMDRLADAVGISGWEMRSRNIIKPGVVWGPGQIMDDGSRGIRECLDAVKPAYDAARADGKAVGLGLALKNSGLGNGFVEISKAVIQVRGRRNGRGAPLLDRDGSGRPQRGAPGRSGGTRHRPGSHQRHGGHDEGTRRRPDDGFPWDGHGRRWSRRRLPGRQGGRPRDRRRLLRRIRRRLDRRPRGRRREPDRSTRPSDTRRRSRSPTRRPATSRR